MISYLFALILVVTLIGAWAAERSARTVKKEMFFIKRILFNAFIRKTEGPKKDLHLSLGEID